MSAEQNALALLDSLSEEQRRQLADLCNLVYEAGFDHGNGIGNQLDRLDAGDPRQPLQQIVKLAMAARQEVTRQALRWERAAAEREEQYTKLVEQDQPAEQPAAQVEQVEQPAEQPAGWAIIQVSADRRYMVEEWTGEPYTQHAAVQGFAGPYDLEEALAHIKANGLKFYQYEEEDTEV